MYKQAVGFVNDVKFNFYTYNSAGIEVIIPIFAEDEESAWKKFDRIYGETTPVDKVKRT